MCRLLAASIPMLAYAVLKGCAHATTSLVGSLSPAGVAASIGSATADNNLSLDNISHGSRAISQQQYAPSLTMGGGFIDDGGMRVITTGQGEQIINQPVDNLPTNYRLSSMQSDSIQTQLSSQQSMMTSATDRESGLTSLDNRLMTDLTERFARGEASIAGISTSEQESMRVALSKGVDSKASDNYKDSKETSTNSSTNLGFELAGSGAKTGTSAANSQSSAQEMSVSEQRSYNEAQEKLKSAARTGNINSSNEQVKSLTSGLSNSWSQQQSIGQEKARIAQNIESLQQSKSYIESNSATIDRNFNDEVLQGIIDRHPEINSKAQAARWISSHQSEADGIAKQLMFSHSNLPSKDWSNSDHKASEFASIGSDVNNITIRDTDSLKNEYNNEARKVEDKAVVTDVTNQEKPLKDMVKDQVNSTRMMYNSSAGQLLHNNLSGGEREQIKDLNTATIPNLLDKKRELENYHQNTPNSTIFRTVGESDKRIAEFTEGGAEIIEKIKK